MKTAYAYKWVHRDGIAISMRTPYRSSGVITSGPGPLVLCQSGVHLVPGRDNLTLTYWGASYASILWIAAFNGEGRAVYDEHCAEVIREGRASAMTKFAVPRVQLVRPVTVSYEKVGTLVHRVSLGPDGVKAQAERIMQRLIDVRSHPLLPRDGDTIPFLLPPGQFEEIPGLAAYRPDAKIGIVHAYNSLVQTLLESVDTIALSHEYHQHYPDTGAFKVLVNADQQVISMAEVEMMRRRQIDQLNIGLSNRGLDSRYSHWDGEQETRQEMEIRRTNATFRFSEGYR